MKQRQKRPSVVEPNLKEHQYWLVPKMMGNVDPYLPMMSLRKSLLQTSAASCTPVSFVERQLLRWGWTIGLGASRTLEEDAEENNRKAMQRLPRTRTPNLPRGDLTPPSFCSLSLLCICGGFTLLCFTYGLLTDLYLRTRGRIYVASWDPEHMSSMQCSLSRQNFWKLWYFSLCSSVMTMHYLLVAI